MKILIACYGSESADKGIDGRLAVAAESMCVIMASPEIAKSPGRDQLKVKLF